jgi:hypothetical protein
VSAAIIERIETMVRRLENAPPPRSVTVDLEDLGAPRITVTLTADGVRLSVPEAPSSPTTLLSDLEAALAARGFDLAGGDDRHRRGRHPEDETTTFVPPRPEARRPDDAMRL